MTKSSHHLSVRSRVAKAAGGAARFASRALGRGSGGMIGGEVAMRISPTFLSEVAALLFRHRDRYERKVDDDAYGAGGPRKRRTRRFEHQW